MIEHQNKNNFKKLEAVFTEMAKLARTKSTNNAILNKKYGKKIISITSKLFGIKLDLKIQDDPSMAYCYPNPINLNNPKLPLSIRTDLGNIEENESDLKDFDIFYSKYSKILKENNNVLGTIDEKHAKLGGGLTKIPVVCVLDITMMARDMGVRGPGITGIFLHEMGHIWDFFESSAKIRSGNIFFMESIKELKKASKSNFSAHKYTLKVRELSEEYGVDELMDEQIKDTDSRYVLMLNMSKMLGQIAKSEIADITEDHTETERAADMFASRCGYGLELSRALSLVTGQLSRSDLSLIHRNKNSRAVLSLSRNVLMTRIGFLYIIAATMPMGILFSVLILIGVVYITFFNLAVKMFKNIFRYLGMRMPQDNPEDYDDIHIRLNRIRRNTLSRLKDAELDKDTQRVIISTLDEMNQIVKIVERNTTHGVTAKLDRFVTKALTGNKLSSSDFTDILEEVNTNKLYEASARIAIL